MQVVDEVSREQQRTALAERLIKQGASGGGAVQRVVALAARLFEAPWAAVTLVGANSSCSETAIGDAPEPLRGGDVATRVIASDDVLVVGDATLDPRFQALASAPDQGWRFYAGAPLRTATGLRIGAFWIADVSPRETLSPLQERLLQDLADIATSEIESRHQRALNGILHGIAQTVGAGLICTDGDGEILYLNPAAEKLLGYRSDELLGRSIDCIVPERFVEIHRQRMAQIAAGAGSKVAGEVVEATALRKDGSELAVDLSLSVWGDERGLKINSTLRDITERKQREEHLSKLAYHDPLTGLPRAAGLKQTLEAELEQGDATTLLLIEIDEMQSVNDTLGHAIGDALLYAVAARLVAAVPHGTALARWSGNVFAAKLRESDQAKILEIASDIEMALAEPFEIDGHTVVVGASMGAATAPAHARTANDLAAVADLALQRAKTDPGQSLRFFERSMQTQSAARRAQRDEVRQALQAGELVLYYQPQVSLATGAIIGAEALMRWRHPTRGLLTPDAFILAMDDSTLALHAGWWSLDQACRQIARWRAERRPPIRVGVNLFAAQLRYGGLTSVVADLMATHGVARGELELEVRETIANQDEASVIAALGKLRELGVGIALDDFGTGFASLSSLKRLPISTLKIDRSFVNGLAGKTDSRAAVIAAAIIDVGCALGLDVVAEGIETAAQAAALRRMGCPIGQGYLYGRPDLPDRLFEPAKVRMPHLRSQRVRGRYRQIVGGGHAV